MHAASPIAHIDAVRAPVMLMLGLQDRRVPPADGLAYARALRCVSTAHFLQSFISRYMGACHLTLRSKAHAMRFRAS